MRDLTVDQHFTWNGSVPNHPYKSYLMTVKSSTRDATPNALHHLCLVDELFISLMSARFSLRSCSPLKKVFHKLEDSYHTYHNTYKTHTMATHYGGTGQPLERNPNPQEVDTDTPNDCQHEDIDDFENVEDENHAQLNDLTKALDHLWLKVDTTKGQSTEAINCLECELHRLSLALCPSAPPNT